MRIRRARRIEIVVARRYEHGRGDAAESLRERLAGLGIGAVGIQKVAGKEHKINLLGLCKLCDTVQQSALLLPAPRSLCRTKPLKGESRCRSAA